MTTTRTGAPTDPFWSRPAEDVLRELGSTTAGLSSDEVERRHETFGPNRLAPPRRGGWTAALAKQFTEPIVLILLFASGLSIVLHDVVDAVIIFAIVVLSGLLSFSQEHRANVAVQRLLALVQIHTDLRRDGRDVETSFDDVVPGDIVVLNAGDVVPCDCRLLSAEGLQVDAAALTGETFPRHKHADPAAADAPLAERHSAVFLGSHVVSGRGDAVAVATGPRTELGLLSKRLEEVAPRSSFEDGIRHFGLMLARVTGVLTTVIFVINLLLHRPFADSLLFSLALAVGLTPQMLPAIVSVSLSAGARRMANRRVIVRRLDSIEDFGAMDTLCTDKTGTLTEGTVRVHAALGVDGFPSDDVVATAALNASLQTGYTNPIDDAVLSFAHPEPGCRALDEVPFDFDRKRLSVLAETPAGRRLLTKGAFESVIAVCGIDDEGRSAALARYRELSEHGFRVLGVAEREMPDAERIATTDERDLRFLGFLVLEDPPKQRIDETLRELGDAGIVLRMITGDNALAAAHIANVVGLDSGRVMTGVEVEALDDHALIAAVKDVHVFAEVDPIHKERILRALREGGATVGYMGDGINDAGALHLADVGISVDTAVDVAKSAAAIVLLEKDLRVLLEGVRLGRQTFANTIKYIFTTVSANFGNMTSMAAASAFLPFLPLLPRQILLLNFLSDIPSMTIAADRVDVEQQARPQRWDMRFIRDFMIVFGLLSSAFDLLTFAVLLQVFHAHASLFRSGWFVGSTLTELAVLLVLRTRRRALRSRPGTGLLVSSIVVAAVTLSLPYLGPFAHPLALIALPVRVIVTIALITLAYVVAAEVVKPSFYRAMEHTEHVRPPKDVARHRLVHAVREHGGPVRNWPATD